MSIAAKRGMLTHTASYKHRKANSKGMQRIDFFLMISPNTYRFVHVINSKNSNRNCWAFSLHPCTLSLNCCMGADDKRCGLQCNYFITINNSLSCVCRARRLFHHRWN